MKTIIAALLLIATGASAQKFHPLLNSSGETVITNAEFSNAVGRKIVFKDIDSGQRKAFDVTNVHPDVLTTLSISVESATANGERIVAENKKRAEFFKQQEALRQKAKADKAEADRRARIRSDEINARWRKNNPRPPGDPVSYGNFLGGTP